MTTATDASGAETRLFTGESVCTAAIERLGRGGAQIVYWMTGHGEAATGDYDPQTGYSDMAREITRNGFELRDIRLWETKGVPGDAAALVVAAPQHAVAPEEVGWVQDYLNKGGRLLYLAPSRGRSGLEEVLSRWGLVITPFRAISTRTLSGGDRVITAYADHPITRSFGKTATVFLMPWCIGTVSSGDAQGADRIRVTSLAQTADDGWGEAGAESPPRFEPETDIVGPVVVAASAERGGGTSAELGFKPTKIVVVGEASFISNGMLGLRLNANRDLLLNMLNWLTGIDSAGQPSLGDDAALACGLDRAGWMRVIFWVVGVLPGAVLVVGGVVAIRNRRAG
jgi:ABC-2 type transport system permease protein